MNEKSSGSRSRKQRLTAVGIRCPDHVTPLYPQKLALTSPTGGGRSVGIVRVRTKATEFSFSLVAHRMRNVSDNSCRENQNTHLCSLTPFENCAFCKNNVEKYCRAGQSTHNMARAHFMLITSDYKYTQSDCVILTASPLQRYLH